MTATREQIMQQFAVGYIRVSSEQQVVDGVSLEAQRARIEAYALLNGLQLSAVFCDAGISGKRADNRPELQNALNEVCKAGGVLIVYSLSRLARSTKDTLSITERLEKASADLVSLSEKIDTTSAAGKMVFRMLAVLAEFERDLISERTRTAMQHKRNKGERIGTIPFGFTLSEDGVALLEDQSEQDTVSLIQSLRKQGQSYERIADELNRRGIPTKKGGSKWRHTSVVSILKRAAA